MSYQVKLIDPAERDARIEAAIKAPVAKEDFDFFRDQIISLPVIRIPLDLPIYRMGNFRTFSEQAEHVAREHTVPEFFSAGQEKESVQQVQHEILAKLSAKGKANSVVPVIDVLEREGQRERLLITRRGVVVNGNRRLAAMRELYDRDAQTFSKFSHVNCLVLPPDTTPEDILEIEGILQARPETRLDYDWIGDAQLLAAMLKSKGTADAVAKRLGRKVAEVKNVIQALAEADLYLKDWAKAPGEYRRVAEDGEQLFKDLPSLLAGKAAGLQEASRVIAWSLFDNRGKLEGRIYNYNIAIGKRAPDVLDRLAEEAGISTISSEPEKASTETFEFEFGGEQEDRIDYDRVVAALRGTESRDEAIESLVDICTSIVESEKDKKSGGAALKAATVANSRLAEIDLSRAEADTYDGLQQQLDAIAKRVEKLQSQLTEIIKTAAHP